MNSTNKNRERGRGMNSTKLLNTNRMMVNPELTHQFNGYVTAFAKKTGKTPWKNVFGDKIFRSLDGAAVKFDISSSRFTPGTLGNNIADAFKKIAIDFLVQKIHPNDVPDTIRQCWAFNHNNAHWTAVVVSSENFKEGYKKIYDACISSVKSDANAIEFDKDAFLSGQNALECALGLREAQTLKDKNFSRTEQRKIFLNTFAKNISVKHYDSTHVPHYFQQVQTDLEPIASHIKLTDESCANQTDNTCGDHTIYNLFTKAILNKAPDNQIQSNQLRTLTQTLAKTKLLKKIIKLMDEEEIIRNELEAIGEFDNTEDTKQMEKTNALITETIGKSIELTLKMAKTNALIAETVEKLKIHTFTPNELQSINEVITAAQNAKPTLVTDPKLNAPPSRDILVNDVENLMVDAIISLKEMTGYDSIIIIHLIIHNPNMTDELKFKKFVENFNRNRKEKNKNTPVLKYSPELHNIVKNIANLVKGEIKLLDDKNPTEKIICKAIAVSTAQEFCIQMMQEQFNSIETTEALTNSATSTTTSAPVLEKPKPPEKVIPNPTLPPVTIDTTTHAAPPVIVDNVTPVAPIVTAPQSTTTPPVVTTPVIVEPTPSITRTQKKSTLLRDVGISIGSSSVIGTLTAVAIGIVVGASIAMPLLIGVAVTIALIGTLIGTIISAVKNKNREPEKTTAKNGSYSMFSNKMPLLKQEEKKSELNEPKAGDINQKSQNQVKENPLDKDNVSRPRLK